jgi:hypothetical protein
MSDSKPKKAEMIQALRMHKAVVWKACNAVGITRYQHNDWMRDDPDYREVYESIKEDRLDFVESKMIECIDGIKVHRGYSEDGEPIIYDVPPNDKLIQFYLKTQGKKRGYVERQEVTGAEGERLQIVIGGNI